LTRKTLNAKHTIHRACNESVAQDDLTEQKKKNTELILDEVFKQARSIYRPQLICIADFLGIKSRNSLLLNCIIVHFYSSRINHQQMHLRIIKKFNTFLGTLLHVSALRCHPQGALSSWLKLIIA
jgi:hypothetical protein